jgi:acetyl esterase/lipase
VDANLTGLPPITIINAQIDPLRDDGKMLEDALKAAHVSVERKVYDGVAHEFFGMAAVIDEAKDAQRYAGDRLKSAFNR